MEWMTKSVKISLISALLLTGIGSCQFLIPSLRRYYNDYQVINRTGSAITAMAYYQGKAIDGFVIRSGHFHRMFIDERDLQSIFHSELADSVVVVHEKSQKYIVDYCGGEILTESSCSDDNQIKSIARMGTGALDVTVQKVRDKVGDRYISFRYTLILEEEDFR